MELIKEISASENKSWFKTWFDSNHYHKLYCNRSEKQAADFIEVLIDELKPGEGSKMLDLGCGSGRHCRALSSKGYDVTGLDLSFNSIREAKKFESNSLHFFQHDMRLPFGKKKYDFLFNFFTSFGYFQSTDEHSRVIKNMSDALKPGGKLIIDYMNVHFVNKNIVEFETKEIDGIIYRINRWKDEKYFYKKITINDNSNEPLEFTEQVARFTLVDFMDMFTRNGLRLQKTYGDYLLNDYDINNSSRLIMIADKQ